MPPRFIFIRFFLTLALLGGLFGCSSGKPTVWVNQQIVFSEFDSFEVVPVFNATGRPVAPDMLENLTYRIKMRLEDQDLPVGEPQPLGAGVLVVKSDLVILVICEPLNVVKTLFPSYAGKSQCTVRTRLLDKTTNRILAEISTTREAGGCSLNPLKTYEWVFDEVAKDIAKEVARIMSPGNSS